MKRLALLVLILSTSFTIAETSIKKEKLKEKHIKQQIEKEKKYSEEQTFYKGKNYDFKGAEVDDESVKKIPDLPNTNEDFDMNSVYD